MVELSQNVRTARHGISNLVEHFQIPLSRLTNVISRAIIAMGTTNRVTVKKKKKHTRRVVKWRQEVSYRDSKESYLIGCDGHPPERFELFFSIRGCSEDPSTNVTDIDRSCTIYRDFFASIFRLSNYLIARSRAPFHRDRIDLVSSVHRVTGRSIKTEKLRIYGD